MPLVITAELTGEVWSLPAAPTAPAFLFDGNPPYDPGIYTIVNQSGATANVVLFGQSFTLLNNSKWQFVAHQDMGGFNWVGKTPISGVLRRQGL